VIVYLIGFTLCCHSKGKAVLCRAVSHICESALGKKVTMEIVCIYSSDDEVEIESMKNQLEENGIPTMIKNLYTQNLFSGIKLFSGHDAIAGSIQLYVREDEVHKSYTILKESGFDVGDEPDSTTSGTEEIPESDEHRTKAAAPDDKEEARIVLYPAYILTCLSIFVIPFFINIAILIGLRHTKKNASIMLGILGAALAITGGFFMTRFFLFGGL
jgi:hypothetical protein